MFTVTRHTTLQAPFTPEAAPSMKSPNAVRKPHHHGMAARWMRVDGKLECQWDMQ